MSNLLENDTIVDCLRLAIVDGKAGLSDVPSFLKRVLREEMWRERIIHQTGELVKFERFTDFVTTLPLEGLGASLDLIKRIVATDPEALDLLDRVIVGKPGGDGSNQYSDRANSNIVTVCSEIEGDNLTLDHSESIRGNAAQYALRKLRKDAPELHAQVLAGELSPHRAMVEAGFRVKMISVPLDPERAARVLRKYFSAEEMAVLIQVALTTEE